ncbi:phosphotransferase [Nonomuraea dietziae]|uniref:Ser/Thr protein kinase RdoA (MazF antagonist) n=1 Tax=Nonomuraea dietziae TaxID=65515 RepID=A0A7W5V3N8_9ACTN|nr:phosphotransferase [Nonomuraea dietziae]MBB3724405.1 Ser/Thr protein kinase RdoA (MazF antagonist) [Nonomuraea dietziae]
MTRLDWEDLPETVRAAVQDRCGAVVKAETATSGIMPGVAARLHTEHGSVFLKAVNADNTAAFLHIREQWASRALPAAVAAPRLLWSDLVEGWHVMGFEYLEHAREADLSPDSPDLHLLLATVADLGRALTPCPAGARGVAENIAPLQAKGKHLMDKNALADDHGLYVAALDGLDLAAVEGDTFLHYDLSPSNLLVTPAGVRVIDWSFAACGAAWVEPVMLAPRLIEAGHTPAQTEDLLELVPAWRTAPPAAVTGLVALWTLFRLYKAQFGPELGRAFRARAADAGHSWLAFRLGA